MKTCVAFYSLQDHTRQLAQAMADEIGGDLADVRLAKQPNVKGFMAFMWAGFSTLTNKTPALAALDLDLADYDLILIGTPVWAGTLVPALRSLLAQSDLSGKKVALFASCGGGPGKACDELASLLPNSQVLGQTSYAWSGNAKTEDLLTAARGWAREMVALADQ